MSTTLPRRPAPTPATDEPSPVLGDRLVGWVLTIGGLIGGLAAFVLVVEKVALLRDPTYTPSCSINPILSCGSVMTTPQAEAFGFPNPLIGVAAFPIVVATGVALLGGVRLPRWWWLGLQVGALFGVGFVHWLFFQSLYRINALCPYCMAVWVAMIFVFCYTTLYNVDRGHLPAPPALRSVARFHTTIPVAWLLVLTVLIGERFWIYWRTLL